MATVAAAPRRGIRILPTAKTAGSWAKLAAQNPEKALLRAAGAVFALDVGLPQADALGIGLVREKFGDAGAHTRGVERGNTHVGRFDVGKTPRRAGLVQLRPGDDARLHSPVFMADAGGTLVMRARSRWSSMLLLVCLLSAMPVVVPADPADGGAPPAASTLETSPVSVIESPWSSEGALGGNDAGALSADQPAEEAVALPEAPGPLAPAGQWTNWAEVPGGGFGAPTGTTFVVYHGTWYLFGIGANHLIFWNRKDPTTGWTGWQYLDARYEYSLTAVTAVVWEDTIYLFYVGSYGNHYYKTLSSPSGAWSQGQIFNSYNYTVDQIEATVFRGRLYVFSLQGSSPKHAYYSYLLADNTWYPFIEVGGSGWTDFGPEGAIEYNRELWLFGLGSDRRIYYNRFDGYTWTTWYAMPTTESFAAMPTPVVYNNRLYLYGVMQPYNYHYVNEWNGTAWTGWTLLTSSQPTTMRHAAGVADGQTQLFTVWNGRHYMKSCTGTPLCGGCCDKPDVVFYKDYSGDPQQVGINGPRNTMYLNGWTWPDGSTMENSISVVYIRQGYKLQVCNGTGLTGLCHMFNGTGSNWVLSGWGLDNAVRSFDLVQTPTLWTQHTTLDSSPECNATYSTDLQGIAHSNKHWYITTTSGIMRFPVTYDMCGDGDDAAPDRQWPPWPFGCEHVGSPAYYDDHVYVPVRNCPYFPSATLVVFDRDLNVTTYQTGPGGSWVAVNPTNGYLYAGAGQQLRVYDTRALLGPPGNVQPLYLANLPGWLDPLVANCSQGAAFSENGLLYMNSDNNHDAWEGQCDANGGTGLWVFEVDGTDATYLHFEYVWPPDGNYEVEGVVVWDLDFRWDVPAWHMGRQLHLAYRNNGLFDRTHFYSMRITLTGERGRL